MRTLFYEILKAGLWGNGINSGYSHIPDKSMETLFEMGTTQAVTGILATGMETCGIKPADNSIKWIKELMIIERKNRKMLLLTERILELLGNNGIDAEVFKGVTVAKWYKNPLARGYGDIDVVVNENIRKIEDLLKENGIVFVKEHQDVVCRMDGIRVEFHPQREYAYCPKDNRTLQRLVKNFPDSKEVYLACIIIHLRRHMLTYGVGMKQVCDVAVMLKNADLDMNFMADIIRELNMEKFCAALFGFIKKRLDVQMFPCKAEYGKYCDLIECIVWKDGYVLKINKEKRNRNLSPAIRIITNVWFWTRRCVMLAGIMPHEAIWFIPYMTKRRMTLKYK